MKYTIDYHPEETSGLKYFWRIWSPPFNENGSKTMTCVALAHDEVMAQRIADLLTEVKAESL